MNPRLEWKFKWIKVGKVLTINCGKVRTLTDHKTIKDHHNGSAGKGVWCHA